MSATIVFFWRIRDHRDGETATASVGDLKLHVQDCDGDSSDWEIMRGDACLAMGNDHGHEPYHFDAAKALCETVARAIVNADERNAFLLSDTWLKGCLHCGRMPEEHGLGWHSTCSAYAAPNRKVSA